MKCGPEMGDAECKKQETINGEKISRPVLRNEKRWNEGKILE